MIRYLNDHLNGKPVVLFLCLIAGLAAGMAKLEANRIDSAHQIEDTRRESEDRSNKAIQALVIVQVANCQNDHRFRVQYKQRGITEKRLVEFFLALAEGNADSTSESFVKKFKPLAENIRIIPVPNCAVAAAVLHEALKSAGIEVPETSTDHGGKK